MSVKVVLKDILWMIEYLQIMQYCGLNFNLKVKNILQSLCVQLYASCEIPVSQSFAQGIPPNQMNPSPERKKLKNQRF